MKVFAKNIVKSSAVAAGMCLMATGAVAQNQPDDDTDTSAEEPAEDVTMPAPVPMPRPAIRPARGPSQNADADKDDNDSTGSENPDLQHFRPAGPPGNS